MPKKIKILFSIPNFDTAGSGKVVYDLVKGLDKEQFEPHIVCTHNKGAFFKQVESLGVPVHIFQFYTPYKPYISLPFRLLKIVNFFKKHQFDIIHSWHWSSDITEPLAAKLAGIPFVYTKKAMGWGNKVWLWRSKLSTCVITINHSMQEQFFKNTKVKTQYLPLGVDTSHFQVHEKAYVSPEGITATSNDFVIVSVANLVPVKGIEVLLEAVSHLNNPRIKTFIVGDDQSAYAQDLKKRYTHLNHLHFTGKQRDVRPYLALADVCVISTLQKGEGLPIAPLEAMASGNIVIGSEVPGVIDLLSNFQEQLFPAGDAQDLAKKITAVMAMDGTQRKDLAMAMRKEVEQRFTLQQMLEGHEGVYARLAGR
ncbi:glycosyltransferase [Paucihalobacter ruber]|uniref:Glycosyltransferase n=1 Tax=Paucihalobacter ruber TaxID=2567861 RepID=A0A506PJ06_9FLAO|nr:glycosyltransferase [Paucihalobacter ruber]TPV33846.1 glycosyltransferase [Paucihalobacter ruber]